MQDHLKSTDSRIIEAHQDGWRGFFSGRRRNDPPQPIIDAPLSVGTAWMSGWDAACNAARAAYPLAERRGEILSLISDGEALANELLRTPKATSVRFQREAGCYRERAELLRDAIAPRVMERVGKVRAGRLLDGREWSEFPIQNSPADGSDD